MHEVLSELALWKERGDRIALATVIDVQRSAPRPPGAKMAVNEHGEIAGSVSGGCVEGAVAEIADGILQGDPPQLVHFGIADSDAWDVGLPCGGEIDVWVEAYEPGRFEDVARAGGRAAEAVTDFSGGTRIGESLANLNREHGRRVGRGAVVVILSDGWDRGDPDVLALEMARLRRSAHRLVWLNPLAAHPEFAPLTRGMRAAIPHTDELLAGNSLASLEQLAVILEEI